MSRQLTDTLHGFFITATDTGCGKTLIGSLLTKKLYQEGFPVQPRKPIESGCLNHDGQLIPEDGLCYFEATEQSIALDTITPYKLPHAVSPARAADIVGKTISCNDLFDACIHTVTANSILIVEGAGGFYSPLANNASNATLAKMLQLPILLVASNKLGCINHIMLTLQAAESQKLVVSAIILNQTEPLATDNLENNFEYLQALTHIPIVEFPFITDTGAFEVSMNRTLRYLTDLIKK